MPDRRIILGGVAATIAIVVCGFVVVAFFSFGTCGFMNNYERGTFSADLCTPPLNDVAFVLTVLAPLLVGLGGTFRARAAADKSRLRAPLLVAGAIPVLVAALYAISGELPALAER